MHWHSCIDYANWLTGKLVRSHEEKLLSQWKYWLIESDNCHLWWIFNRKLANCFNSLSTASIDRLHLYNGVYVLCLSNHWHQSQRPQYMTTTKNYKIQFIWECLNACNNSNVLLYVFSLISISFCLEWLKVKSEEKKNISTKFLLRIWPVLVVLMVL